ncbi:cellulose synthase subunit [Paralcaligenes ureilyticus]|uniref:Cyclic di-GMP-binding protein n=2 Tax=Paralcaligenes ureilyticus TaxID=627131 RepID=A0A4R3M3U9_9BURK|nr:cellulose synthase subunit [Paralcaligenes ureilyticus]
MRSGLIILLFCVAMAGRIAVAAQPPEDGGQAASAGIVSTVLPSSAAARSKPAVAQGGVYETVTLPFSKLGAFRPIHLKGITDSKSIGVGIRLDRVVTAARLRLTYSYSPALVFSVSHIRVLVNQQVVATVPFTAANAGSPVTQQIELNPLFFTSFNQITLEPVAHYTIDKCEDPANSALWVDISPSSELILDEQAVALPNDLGLLPAPFFDRGDTTRLVLPFMLGAAPNDQLLRSAGVVASWFGVLTDYRGARFPVVHAIPADKNVVLIGKAADLPPLLKIAAVDGPTIAILSNPGTSDKKILLISGRNDQEVQTAAEALVLGKAVLAGARTTVDRVDIGPPRKPYDAPKWLPLDGPVQFKNIVASPDVLQVRGGSPDPIRIDMHVPADLFGWTGHGVPLDLKYRYTAPSVVNDSMLTVNINDELVKSYRLTPRRPEEDKSGFGFLRVPLLNDAASHSGNALNIPAFRVGSDNQLQLQFTLDSQKSGMCSGLAYNPARAAIDPDSTIDFSGFAHYAVMPNLAFFANSGFPFTTLADLAGTAIVIPDHPDSSDLQAMLTVLGYMGKWTGIPAMRVQVLHSSQVRAPLDKDLIVIGSGPSAALLEGWDSVSALRIAALPPIAGEPKRYAVSLMDKAGGGSKLGKQDVTLSQDGRLGILMGLQSPLQKSRSIVALTGTDPQGLLDVVNALDDPGKVSVMKGGLVVARDGKIESASIGGQYMVGDLPWYAQIWLVAIKHPMLLALLGILAGILVSVGVFLGLQSLSSRRRGV